MDGCQNMEMEKEIQMNFLIKSANTMMMRMLDTESTIFLLYLLFAVLLFYISFKSRHVLTSLGTTDFSK